MAHLEKKYIDYDFTQEGVIWAAKGGRKNCPNEYFKYAYHLKKQYTTGELIFNKNTYHLKHTQKQF